ncbi:MAG: T9SS type A sorting domain-containing protein [Ignavibacteria bacterium]|nr:T9SS type A sorting domain-containing protein [Ignavibacteria bacterium]
MPSPFTSTEAMCTKLPLLRLALLAVVGVLCQITTMAQWQRAVIVRPQYLDITEIHIANPMAVVVGGLRNDTLVIARSSDRGATFTIVYEALTFGGGSGILTMTSVNDSVLFACGERVFVVSSDTGRSWSDATPLLPDSILSRLGTFYNLTSSASYRGQYTVISGYVGGNFKPIYLRYYPHTGTWQVIESLAIYDGMTAVSDRVVYAHIWDSEAYKSVDTGSTYSRISRDPLYNVYDISFSDSIVGRVAGWWFSSTTDGGVTWNNKQVCRHGCSSVVFVDTLNGWIGSSQALFRTTDGGLTWQDQTKFIDTRPLPSNYWDAKHLAAIDSNIAFFGGREGLWVTFNGGVGTTSADPSGDRSHPNGLQLSPNPAIDDITITTPTASAGRLLIVDQAGRTVFERVVASTSSIDHTLRVSTDQFQRGVYLVLFQSADGVVAEKLLVSW